MVVVKPPVPKAPACPNNQCRQHVATLEERIEKLQKQLDDQTEENKKQIKKLNDEIKKLQKFAPAGLNIMGAAHPPKKGRGNMLDLAPLGVPPGFSFKLLAKDKMGRAISLQDTILLVVGISDKIGRTLGAWGVNDDDFISMPDFSGISLAMAILVGLANIRD